MASRRVISFDENPFLNSEIMAGRIELEPLMAASFSDKGVASTTDFTSINAHDLRFSADSKPIIKFE